MKEKFYSICGEGLMACVFLFTAIFAYYKAMFMTSRTWYSPSVFPKLTSLIIVFLCSYEIISFLKKSKDRTVELRERGLIDIVIGVIKYAVDRNVLFMIVMVLVLAFLLPLLHFTYSTLVFLFACMLFYGERKGLRSLITYALYSVGFVAFSIVVFRTVFQVILP